MPLAMMRAAYSRFSRFSAALIGGAWLFLPHEHDDDIIDVPALSLPTLITAIGRRRKRWRHYMPN